MHDWNPGTHGEDEAGIFRRFRLAAGDKDAIGGGVPRMIIDHERGAERKLQERSIENSRTATADREPTTATRYYSLFRRTGVHAVLGLRLSFKNCDSRVCMCGERCGS